MNNNVARKHEGIKVTVLSVLAFVCGAASVYKFNVVGEIYAGEILLMIIFPFALFLGRSGSVFGRPVFRYFLFFAVLAVVGYMLSDLYQGTESSQYIRGWGRWGIFLSDLIALSVLVENHKRNLWWYALGMGIGGIVFMLSQGLPLTLWKFGYGVPFTYVIVCLSFLLPARLASAAIVALSLLSIGFDFRSLGGETLAVAIVLWVRSRRPGRANRRLKQILSLAGATILGGFILIMALTATQKGTEIHRDESNAGRLAGIKVGLIAIQESPLIGWGSWTVNEKFAQMETDEYKNVVERHGGEAVAGSLFSPHSQILQVWVEGGLLAAIFFIYYGYQLVLTMKYILLTRTVDAYTAIFFLVLIGALWDLFLSPFLGYTRMSVAFAAAVICAMAAERAGLVKNAKLSEKPGNNVAVVNKSV